MGRLIGTTTQYAFLPGTPAPTFSNSYAYDAASNRTSFTAPDGSTNTYAYDMLNRLTTLTDSGAGQFTMGYDALSRRTQLVRPNGITTSYGYDPVSHLQSVLHKLGVNTLDGATYAYDLAGNRTSKANQLNSTVSNYGYDNIYQLTGVTQGASSTEAYTFDPVGNRLSSLSVPSYAYNSSNEITAAGSSTSYTYDNNGNTLSKADRTGTSTFTWDFENRLTSVQPPNQTTVTFKYDPFGRRIQKGGSVYVYDGANLSVETDGAGNLAARYVFGSGIDEPLAVYRGATWKFYQADGLGSVTSLSTSAGTISDSFVYDSFGNVTSSTGTFTQPFRYTGREWDAETGLYYYRARYYDPDAGRFLTQDPMQFKAGANNYRYVHNRPTTSIDPLGLLDAFIWYPKGDFFGHSAAMLADGTYISWWPDVAPRTPKKTPCGCIKDNVYHAPAITGRKPEDDISDEERPADKVIHIDGLDEAAIAAWWNAFKSNPNKVWDSTKQNCSTTVYEALNAGGGFSTVEPVWSPNIIAIYAEEVKIQMMIIQLLKTAGPPDLSGNTTD